jgi:hypothetical protein
MAKTGAERQAELRQKKKTERDENGHQVVQMNVYVTAPNRARLSALAKRHGVTQAQILNRIIDESALVKELEQDKDDFLAGRFSNGGE